MGAEIEAWERRPRPESLPDGIVRKTGRRRDEARPVPVRALVPVRISYGDVIETEAEAIAWTPGGAVLIRYVPPGETHQEHVWLWANAVQRITPVPPATR
ncbi:MAG: hypothetical protein ABI067_10925 [Leifsonia sp.]